MDKITISKMPTETYAEFWERVARKINEVEKLVSDIKYTRGYPDTVEVYF